MMADADDRLVAYQTRVNDQLERSLSDENVPSRLTDAMRYAALAGGKRIRPCLVYLGAEAAGAPLSHADSTAVAVELIHAYSLVHDDLPAMDDDDLRRGQPTCHVKFDEATAILAGDALQAKAFELLARDPLLTAEQRLDIISRLAIAAGPAGMVGGQFIDLNSENMALPVDHLIDMHRRKTGALISTSVVCGGLCGGASGHLLTALSEFGYALGLAFQVRDDILDEVGETDRIGKTAGADKSRRKSTFISAYGVTDAGEQLDQLLHQAIKSLEPLGSSAGGLIDIAEFIARRDH